MHTADNDQCDVTIIGCGPTGATLGLLLRQRGLSVTIFEKDAGIYELPRAVQMDEEIQRVFLNLGLFDELQMLLTPLQGAEFVDANFERLVGFELPEGTLGHQALPPAQMYYQPELDRFLRSKARDAGVDIRHSATVTALRDEGEAGVVVDVDGRPAVRSRWAVGCDGANSSTRKWLGIDFEDRGFDQEWLVVDLRSKHAGVELPRLAQQVCDIQRPITFVPGHGDNCRWEFQLQPGETALEMERPTRVFGLIERWGVTEADLELIRASVYRFHATVATQMRFGSVFLAGDAAHQMPPFLGQGLCSGIRDAANLAWKLAMVHDGSAPQSLLETYNDERRPHAGAVVDHACDTGKLIDQMAGRAKHNIGEDAAYGGGRPFPRLIGGLLHDTNPAVGRPSAQTVASGFYSDNLLGPGFSVVLGDDRLSVPSGWRDLGATIVIDSALARGNGALVIRPDRYVAAVADTQAELNQASDKLLSLLGR